MKRLFNRYPRAFWGFTGIYALVLFTGCAPALLAPDEPRSQFDRYDTVRNQHEDQYVFNQWQSREVNLGPRLSPKE